MKAVLLFLVCCETQKRTVPLPVDPPSFALSGSIAVVDAPMHRVMLLHAGGERLWPSYVGVGKHIVSAQPSADARFLLVLSSGDQPRTAANDERPSLSIIGNEGLVARYELPVQRNALAIDPRGELVALYATQVSDSLIDNPNEIVLISLNAEPSDTNPRSRTLRSFGGRPRRLTFTDPLLIGERARRLLVVETEQDLALLDLGAERPEVTVRLNTGASAHTLIPSGIITDDGEPNDGTDARIAVKLQNDTSLLLLELLPDTGENDFSPRVNLLDAGGGVSDAAFLPTDAGVRVVALSGRQAVLITPQTAVRAEVPLPSSYTRMSFLPAGAPDRRNVLLWGNGVALWDLGLADDRPYASVEALSLSAQVTSVTDIPARPTLKLLATVQSTLYVLDLEKRTVAPLITQPGVAINVPQHGQRLWGYNKKRPDLARVTLDTLQPKALHVGRNVAAVYELEGLVVALHDEDGYGATVMSADAPDEAHATFYADLLLGGIP